MNNSKFTLAYCGIFCPMVFGMIMMTLFGNWLHGMWKVQDTVYLASIVLFALIAVTVAYIGNILSGLELAYFYVLAALGATKDETQDS